MPATETALPAAFDLARHPSAPPPLADKKATKDVIEALLAEFAGLQQLLYANRQQALLVVLQGLDASGKDSTIRHAFYGINPFGLDIHAFKMPSAEELAHDFLWRVHSRTPARGMIGIFNRSHYEAVVSDYVQGLCTAGVREERFSSIRDFESHLVRSGTLVRKFFLHVSRDEQKKRLVERVCDPAKQWKLGADDLEVRRHFDEYLAAWSEAMTATHCADAPWQVVPADNKWYRDFCVLTALVDCLKALQLEYPRPAKPLRPEDVPD